MKISSDWYKEGIGMAFDFLVGDLVLGTALPQLMKELLGQLSWINVIVSTSQFALLGGMVMDSFRKY